MAKPLKLCRMRQISIKEKLSIFKTLAISKIVHLALVKGIPSNKTTQLNKMQREFIWKNKTHNIKTSTLCWEITLWERCTKEFWYVFKNAGFLFYK